MIQKNVERPLHQKEPGYDGIHTLSFRTLHVGVIYLVRGMPQFISYPPPPNKTTKHNTINNKPKTINKTQIKNEEIQQSTTKCASKIIYQTANQNPQQTNHEKQVNKLTNQNTVYSTKKPENESTNNKNVNQNNKHKTIKQPTKCKNKSNTSSDQQAQTKTANPPLPSPMPHR